MKHRATTHESGIQRKQRKALKTAAFSFALGIIFYGAFLQYTAFGQDLYVAASASLQQKSRQSRTIVYPNLMVQPIYISWKGFSPDGKFFAEAYDTDIKVWEAESGKLLRIFKGKPGEEYHYSWSVAFSPDSKLLASGSEATALRVWDIKSGRELNAFVGKSNQTNAVAFSPDGKLLAAGEGGRGRDKTVRIWEVESGRELKSFAGHPSSIKSLSFSPDGRHIAVVSGNKSVQLWDLESGAQLDSFEAAGYVSRVDFLSYGNIMVKENGDHTISFRNIKTRKEMESLNAVTRGIKSIIFSPDGKLIAGHRPGEKTVRVWKLESGKEIGSFEPDSDKGLNSVIFSPDGKTLVMNSDKTIRIWDLRKGTLLKSQNSRFAYLMRFVPGGKVLGFWKNAIYGWDLKNGREFKSALD